jgi:4-aminobutyrate aminotransferase-like enzyme
MDREETPTDRYFKLSRQLEPRFLTEHVPMVWKAARGVTVWDIEGKEYLDCTSGIFVAAIGHSHPKYVKAVCSQVEQLLTCYDRLNEPRIKLAERLLRLIPETRGKNKIYL